MSKTIRFSKEQFVQFCKAFDETNAFDFDENAVEEIGPNKYRYCTTYRDEHNYKSPVELRMEDGIVSWDVQFGWDDAYEEIEDLYWRMVRKFFGPDGMELSPKELRVIREAYAILKSVRAMVGDEDDRARPKDALHFIECLLMEYGGY